MNLYNILCFPSDGAVMCSFRFGGMGDIRLVSSRGHSLSEDDQTKLLSASAEEFLQSDDGDSDPEISLGLLDLFRRREGSEEKGELFYYEMFRLLGACEDT